MGRVSRQTCLDQERDFGGYETMWDASICRKAVTVLYVEGLMLDSMCETLHVQVIVVALQLSSKAAESV